MTTVELPSLRHLRMFETVARLESVSRASLEVRRSQPAVTQAIAKLERMLGIDLIERRPTGSYLTDGGRILLLRTQRLFSQFEHALMEPLVGTPFVDKARLGPVMSRLSTGQALCLSAMAEDSELSIYAKMDVTPRTLLRTIRQIEEIIGRRITRHGAQGTSLTQAGLELARQFGLAMKELDYAREEILTALGLAQSTISIGAMPQCAALVLTSAIDQFIHRSQGVRVKVASGPYDLLLSSLRRGKIDLLFGVLRKPDWAVDVTEEPLFGAPYAVVGRPGHPLKQLRRIDLDDLAAYDWILPQHGTPRQYAFAQLFKGARRKPEARIETNRSDLQTALIENSDRITMISAHEARRLEEAGTLAIFEYPLQAARRFDGIATRVGWHPTAACRQFVDILREAGSHVGGLPQQSEAEGGEKHPGTRKPRNRAR